MSKRMLTFLAATTAVLVFGGVAYAVAPAVTPTTAAGTTYQVGTAGTVTVDQSGLR